VTTLGLKSAISFYHAALPNSNIPIYLTKKILLNYILIWIGTNLFMSYIVILYYDNIVQHILHGKKYGSRENCYTYIADALGLGYSN